MSPRATRRASGAPPPPPEVLLVVEQLRRPVPGGIGTYVRGLCAGLGRLGEAAPPVALYASRPHGADALLGLGPPSSTSRLSSRALVACWDHGLAGPRTEAAVVHSLSFPLVPSPGPAVVTVHDLSWRSHPEAYTRRGRRWHERALRRAARRAEAFVVPSQGVADELVAAGLSVAPGRVEVIEHGCDHLPPPDLAAARLLLEALGVRGEFFLTVSTLEPRKNLARLVAAHRLATARLGAGGRPGGGPGALPLVVAGPRGWGAAAPQGDDVVLAGLVEEGVLSGLYALCRVFCYVPLAEGFGLPVAEAMAAGAPVVASEVPSAGGAALEVSATSVEEIAEAMAALASDEALRAEHVAAGRARAAGLTWEASARAHAGLWRRLAR